MRILVFGGSFDPPHLGHAALLSAAAGRIRPDRILIVPAYQAPHKAGTAAPPGDRVRMIRLGLLPSLPPRLRRSVRLDLREVRSGRRVYTVETLRGLRSAHPGAELHFVLGSDWASSFGSWKDTRSLKALCRWWTCRRPGGRSKIPPFIRVLPDAMPDVSSTVVRAALALSEDVSRWIAPPMKRYIQRKGLYGTKLLRSLKRALSQPRFAHTMAVARLAESLAARWGEHPGRARLAGLLHDIGRSVPLAGMAAYARSRRLKVPLLREIARRSPLLLHATISADLARRLHGVRDSGVLAAIRNHTLGSPGMSRLERVLYVADSASEDRSYAGAAALRRLAFEDLEGAFREAVYQKLRHALSRKAWLHPQSIALWNSLQR